MWGRCETEGGRLSRDDAMRVLGLREGYDAADLARAYRAACLVHHPDKGGSEEMFHRIRKAKERLEAPDEEACDDACKDALNFFIWLMVALVKTSRARLEGTDIHVTIALSELYDAQIKRIEYTRRTATGVAREVLFLELCDFRPEYVLAEKGDYGGDLRLKVRLEIPPCPSGAYRVDHLSSVAELHFAAKISIYEYFYGVRVEARLPNGDPLRIDDFVPHRDGAVCVVPGAGLITDLGAPSARGDLFVVFEVDLAAHRVREEDRSVVRELLSIPVS